MPEGYKHFSKNKPMLLEHFADCVEWWSNRQEIQDTDLETFKAKSFTVNEIVNRGYGLDLCGYPSSDEEILSPVETIRDFKERRAALNSKIYSRLKKLSALLQKFKSLCRPIPDFDYDKALDEYIEEKFGRC